MLNSYAAAKLQHGRTKVPPPPRRGTGRGRGTVLTWNDNYKSKYKMENVWIFHLVCQHTTRARRGGKSRKKRQREVPNAMPHVATCSGSSSGNSNAHVNVNLVNATKHSTATAATTRNNNEWNNSIGHCCGNLPPPLRLPPLLGLATPPWPAWFHMCFYVNFHEISWQHDELPALPPCGTNTPISRRRESGNTTAVTCRNLRDGNQQSGEGGRQLCLMRSWHLAKVVFAVAARG